MSLDLLGALHGKRGISTATAFLMEEATCRLELTAHTGPNGVTYCRVSVQTREAEDKTMWRGINVDLEADDLKRLKDWLNTVKVET